MKNIVKLDLTKYSEEQLQIVCAELSISYNLCLNNKTKHDVCLAFIDVDMNELIAYTLINDPENIKYFEDGIIRMLNSVSLYENYNIEKILLDDKVKKMDFILDKISSGGYVSLLKEEKEYLRKESGSGNIVCVELSKYTDDQILSICEEIMDYILADTFISYKERNVNKVYYDIDRNWILAYTLNDSKDVIRALKNIDIESLSTIKPENFNCLVKN